MLIRSNARMCLHFRPRWDAEPRLRATPTFSHVQFMSSVAEIEQAIARLPRPEFVRLERWFDAERNRKWDAQIEEDSNSGALDQILREVEQDARQGKSKPADEILGQS